MAGRSARKCWWSGSGPERPARGARFHGDEGALVVRLDGGFHGGVTEDPDFQELLVRWFQFGTFCPVMRIHGNRGPREEIINKAGEVREGTGADNEVWSFGEKNYEILTKFIGVREKCAITREA